MMTPEKQEYTKASQACVDTVPRLELTPADNQPETNLHLQSKSNSVKSEKVSSQSESVQSSSRNSESSESDSESEADSQQKEGPQNEDEGNNAQKSRRNSVVPVRRRSSLQFIRRASKKMLRRASVRLMKTLGHQKGLMKSSKMLALIPYMVASPIITTSFQCLYILMIS